MNPHSSSSAWIKAIKLSGGEHGSGILQKKLWRLVSDFVRIRDWYKYGTCVATGKKINHWREGHAGHFKAYSKCNGMFKFDERNIFLQSAMSNSWGDWEDWRRFEDELTDNRGIDVEKLMIENRDTPLKVNDTLVIAKMRDILSKMKDLPEHPEYYQRVMKLYETKT